MMRSPGNKPLPLLTNDELSEMLERSEGNVVYSQEDVTKEMRYRDQKRAAKWPVLIALLALYFQVIVGIGAFISDF